MKIKQSVLAAAVIATLAMGISGQSAASIYGRSYLEVSDFTVVVSDNGGVSPGGGTITSFNATTTNSGSVNGGAPVSTTDNCSTPGGCFYNSGDVTKALDPLMAVGTGGLARPGENNFSFFGPDLVPPTAVYGTADSVVHTAELAGDAATHTQQIAESELIGAGTAASSSSEIQSITGFTFLFTVAGANQMVISFNAALDILAHAFDASSLFGNSQANVNVEFNLAKIGSAISAVWRPDGLANSGFQTCIGGLTCTDSADGFDLNTDAGAVLGGPDDGRAGSGAFLGTVSGLTDGQWRLTLNGTTSTALSRTPTTVPEPGMLALLGIGLLGMGASALRKKKLS